MIGGIQEKAQQSGRRNSYTLDEVFGQLFTPLLSRFPPYVPYSSQADFQSPQIIAFTLIKHVFHRMYIHGHSSSTRKRTLDIRKTPSRHSILSEWRIYLQKESPPSSLQTRIAVSEFLFCIDRCLQRDSKMATEEARISMTLSGLLGQCFSFLYGQPKHMFTAESFHGCLVTFARRAGLYRLIDQNKITYDHVANLSDQALEDRWRGWARREMLRRVVFGLALHAADLATYSLLPRILPMQLSINDHSSDALFEAEDASRWRWILLLFSNNSPGSAPSKLSPRASPTVDTFFPISVMAQKIVNTIQLKEMSRSEAGLSSYIADLTGFYKDMQNLANAFDIFPPLGSSMSDSAISVGFRRQQRVMSVLWHYCCLLRLAKLDELEEVAGREGPPQSHALDAVKSWVRLPHARLATLHCAHILHHATDLRDLAFIVPRYRIRYMVSLVFVCDAD